LTSQELPYSQELNSALLFSNTRNRFRV